jgi:Vacuolar protein sorting-associated protein 62
MATSAALAAALAALSPVVVHDAQERSPLTSVAAAPVSVPGVVREPPVPTAYGRIARVGGGRAWLQYWLFYAQQDQDRGFVRTGRHAGDWEMVQVEVDRNARPLSAVLSQHSSGERVPWAEMRRSRGHPVVYAARGAHGSYARPGVRDRLWPDPNDEADGRGRRVVARLVRVDASNPPWMRWDGRWGGASARWWMPMEQSSPRGPAFQQQGRWSDPDGWARAARTFDPACVRVDACDGTETALGAVAFAVTAAGGAVVLWRRRLRRRARAR